MIALLAMFLHIHAFWKDFTKLIVLGVKLTHYIGFYAIHQKINTFFQKNSSQIKKKNFIVAC